LKLVGKGQYGKVFKAKNNLTEEIVAIKYISFCQDNTEVIRAICREVKIMDGFSKMDNNCHIVGLREVFLPVNAQKDDIASFNGLYLVMDFYPSNLAHVLYKEENKFSREQAIRLTHNFLSAVKYIHSANVIHRDLKPQNILINKKLELKICDFGLARNI